jgi:hypothetical protein
MTKGFIRNQSAGRTAARSASIGRSTIVSGFGGENDLMLGFKQIEEF